MVQQWLPNKGYQPGPKQTIKYPNFPYQNLSICLLVQFKIYFLFLLEQVFFAPSSYELPWTTYQLSKKVRYEMVKERHKRVMDDQWLMLELYVAYWLKIWTWENFVLNKNSCLMLQYSSVWRCFAAINQRFCCDS